MCQSPITFRLRVVPHFSSGIVEGAKRERAWKSPHARKGDTRRHAATRAPFLAWGDFHARSRFARSTIPEEKWGTTRSLNNLRFSWHLMITRFQQRHPEVSIKYYLQWELTRLLLLLFCVIQSILLMQL